MKLAHMWFAAFGFAVARLVFRREPVPAPDLVTRLRSSGLI
jgi:hypothetical protein